MEQISKYFNAEKSESLLFISVGIIAVLIAIYYFIKLKQPFYNGISYAFIAVALIQLSVGLTVYIRSPKDIIRVENIIKNEPTKIQSVEIPRIGTVMKSFKTYKWVEITLLIIGVVFFFYFQPMTLWKGLGLGLAIQSLFMLILDYFAESRGKEYLEFLKDIL